VQGAPGWPSSAQPAVSGLGDDAPRHSAYLLGHSLVTRHECMLSRVAVLTSRLAASDDSFHENRALMLKELALLEQLKGEVQFAGGKRYISRHWARGKLLVRERIELLLDPDSPFLEHTSRAASSRTAPR
jgi:hypothetical protein